MNRVTSGMKVANVQMVRLPFGVKVAECTIHKITLWYEGGRMYG